MTASLLPRRTSRPSRPSSGPAGGVIAGLVGLGLGELAAGVLDRASPVVSVGNTVIDHVPAPIKRFAISSFGTNDKQVLIAGILTLTVLYAAFVGRVAVQRMRWGVLGVGAFGLLGTVAAVTGRTGEAGNAGPVVVASLGALAALATLFGWSRRPGRPQIADPGRPEIADPGRPEIADLGGPGMPDPSGRPGMLGPGGLPGRPERAPAESMLPVGHTSGLDRRRFVLGSAGALGAAGVATLAGRSLQRNGRVVAARQKVVQSFPSAAQPLAPVPASAVAPVRDMTPFLTPNDRFYRIDTALAVPRVDPATWRLEIGGMVERPLSLSYAELLARPLVEHDCTLMCVSNEVGGGLVGNARWRGVLLADLLREAGVKPEATQVFSESVDGWTSGFPSELALDGRQALVAVAMNGEALPFKHGFPARLVIPGIYGYVSATKWLSKITLNRLDDADGYWIPRGWAKLAPIKTASRIDRIVSTSGPPARLVAGPSVIAGVAWAQHRGIAKVEVRIDDGSWQDAHLATVDNTDTWRQWWLPWTATPGRHVVAVRATDNTGATQTEDRADPAPDGATGWHTVSVQVGAS